VGHKGQRNKFMFQSPSPITKSISKREMQFERVKKPRRAFTCKGQCTSK
jgi:hypothetical protein